jgi:hypothetical protein
MFRWIGRFPVVSDPLFADDVHTNLHLLLIIMVVQSERVVKEFHGNVRFIANGGQPCHSKWTRNLRAIDSTVTKDFDREIRIIQGCVNVVGIMLFGE